MHTSNILVVVAVPVVAIQKHEQTVTQLEYYQELSKSNDFSQEQRIKFVDEASKILITINELKVKDDKRKRNETIVLFGISVAVAAVSIATNILVSKFPTIKKIKK